MEKTKVKIAFLSTYPPRECGLATFSESLIKVFDALYVKNQVKVIAVSDQKGKYPYSPRVCYEIDQFDEQSYVDAANYINKSQIEVVAMQHEYGIFGGKDGKYILKFLENVNKPVVTSLHSVLRIHSEHRHRLTQRILNLSNSVIVMTKDAKKMLAETFKIDPSKIVIVPHGVPNIRYDEKKQAKELLGYKGKTLLSTFGLISRGKGIENAINAMAEVVKQNPNALYLVIGATHPNILKQEGESYRKTLIKLINQRKLHKNVQFINRYLDYDELNYYLKATDIYLAPQIDFNQAFSGTLSYAIGCGCAVISSPTYYAKEILAANRGIVSLPDPDLIAQEINKLINNPAQMEKVRLNAYQFARKMVWPFAGLEYLKVIESNLFRDSKKWITRLPEFSESPSISYLQKMTDSFGLVQHSKITEPDYNFGYSLDDQARGLIVCKNYLDLHNDDEKEVRKLLGTYLNFLKNAIDKKGIIHNFIDRAKKFQDEIASPDSRARSFWALAQLRNSIKVKESTRKEVEKLLAKYEQSLSYERIKPVAFILLAYVELGNKEKVEKAAKMLIKAYQENSKDQEWLWFEDKLTWGNAILPYALIQAYFITNNEEYWKIAQQSLLFLEKNYQTNNTPSPVGQDGWYFKGKKRATYDQQPIEAADMILLYNYLFHITSEKKYREKALQWMGWYFGNNIKGVMVYDHLTRGVFDGITRTGVNLNRGAESIVTYLMAYLSFIKKI